jgi:hypothetical protein
MKTFSSFCLVAIATIFLANIAQALPTQIMSPNAYKVPYLGFNGVFNLNAEHEQSIKDPRNPKRIAIEKMERFTFYKDAAGTPIARNCRYAYMGAAPDPKYYSEYKTAVWDLFELVKDEKQDATCNQFKYLTLTAPHDEPIHMHFRYGNEKSSLEALLNMSNAPADAAKFSPWFATYCGGGKTECGKGE